MTYEKHPQRGKATKEAIATIPEYECEPDKLSKCPSCLCMTKTIKGYCGKCDYKKSFKPIPCASCGRMIYRGQTIRNINGKEIHSGCPVPTEQKLFDWCKAHKRPMARCGDGKMRCVECLLDDAEKPATTEGNTGKKKVLGGSGEQSNGTKPEGYTPSSSVPKSVSPAREEQPATDCACKGRHDRHCIFYKEPQCPLPATEEEKKLIDKIFLAGKGKDVEPTLRIVVPLLRAHTQREVEAARKVMQIEIEGEIRIAIMETHDKIIAQQAVEKAMVDMRNNLWARHLEIREMIDRTKTLRPTEKNRLAGFADGLWGAVREIDSRYPNAKKEVKQ